MGNNIAGRGNDICESPEVVGEVVGILEKLKERQCG